MGQVLTEIRCFEGAARVLQRALSIDERRGDGWGILGAALLFLRRDREAEAAMARASELNYPGAAASLSQIQEITSGPRRTKNNYYQLYESILLPQNTPNLDYLLGGNAEAFKRFVDENIVGHVPVTIAERITQRLGEL